MFYNSRLFEDIAIKFEKSINFNTEVNIAKNLKEQRLKLNDLSYNTYEIKYENVINKKMSDIISFFNIMHGRYCGFRFKDWTDYSVSNQIIGTYNDNKKFQLIKTYNIDLIDGSQVFYTKFISKPVKNTVKIYINGVEINNFLIDDLTGIVTINSVLNENDIITADFEFDIPVRFYSDELRIINKTKNISEIEHLKLIEIL